MLGGLLSKIPGLGKIFGGGGGKGDGPSGAPSDPFYVVMADKALGFLKQLPGVGKAGELATGKLGKITGWLSGKFSDLILKSKFLGEIFTHPAGKLRGLMSAFAILGKDIVVFSKSLITNIPTLVSSMISGLNGMFATLGPILGPAVAAGAGLLIGYAVGTAINSLLDKYTQDRTDEGFEGNAVERGLFKLSKWSSIGPAQEFINNQEKMRKNEIEGLKRVNEIRKKKGLGPVTSLDEVGKKEDKTALQLMTPISGPGQTTATTTPLPNDSELESLNALGESLQNTPNSSALTMQHQYEKMLNEGKKPSEVAAEQLGTKLDDTNYYLEGILRNTQVNRSLQSNPMNKRER
jgi:hypothetical protein